MVGALNPNGISWRHGCGVGVGVPANGPYRIAQRVERMTGEGAVRKIYGLKILVCPFIASDIGVTTAGACDCRWVVRQIEAEGVGGLAVGLVDDCLVGAEWIVIQGK